MKKVVFITFILFSQISYSQSGIWTWMNGDSVPGIKAHYGVKGVSSPLNHPSGLYEAAQWTDLQGNFWLYGGEFYNQSVGLWIENTLWKFDPSSNEWTWISGDTIPSQSPVFGIKGIASPNNSPGAIVCASSFTDNSGNLWLFGGSQNSILKSNQLWKYKISTNRWTWMSGDSTFGSAGNYGSQGVPSILNAPPSRHECTSAWYENNNLWLFGGSCYLGGAGNGSLNDLWKYNIGSNEWTWMNGDSTLSVVPVYGVKGIADPLNDPGGRLCYSHWKDTYNNLWLFGGCAATNGAPYFSDMWKYDLSINEWTWMSGSNLQNDSGNYHSFCKYDSLQYPSCRWENKACWTDTCGTFWMMGGRFNEYLNDLWRFNPISNQWKLVNGDIANNSLGNFGTMGVPAITNSCPSRFGAVSWDDQNGNLWLFGGYTPLSSPVKSSGDMWRFTPDSGCSACGYPFTNFTSSNSSICPGTCTDFLNLSANVTSYQWYFPGGSPDTSTLANPINICYSLPGIYDVSLIGTNSTFSDTLTFLNYITVTPFPPAQAINQSGDTLFANQGSQFYQWYFNGNLIQGATGYFYVATASGDYNVVATDVNGCEAEAAIFNVVALVDGEPISSSGEQEINIFPNPVKDEMRISCSECGQEFEISFYNIIGLLQFQVLNYKYDSEINAGSLSPGIYFIKITSNENICWGRFIKS